jgi:hypothetical protein
MFFVNKFSLKFREKLSILLLNFGNNGWSSYVLEVATKN